jgi:hypothetical protein
MSYIVRWRRTDASNWTESLQTNSAGILHCGTFGSETSSNRLSRSNCQVVLKGVRVDDWVFGVSSLSKDGFESPVASAVPGGAFKPWVAPPEPVK